MATVTRYVNTGSTPGGDGTTNGTSGATRAYASLNEAEAALQRTTTDIIEIICDGSTADTTSTTIDGWTISSPGYLIIKGASSHGGKWNTNKYRLVTAGLGILVREQPVRLQDLQIAVDTDSTSQFNCVEFDSNLDSDTRGYVERCVLRSIAATTGKRYGVYLDSNNGKYYIANNVMYDLIGNTNSAGVRNVLELTEAYVYHNTFCGCNAGYYTSAGVTLVRLANNLFQDNTHSMINSSGTSFHSASDYNVCDDNETGNNLVPGSNSIKSTEATFVDEGNDDFHTSDTAVQVANNLYSDANYAVTVDVDGDARPSSGSVYAGADEHVSSSVTGTSAQVVDEATQSSTGTLTNAGTSSQTADETFQAAVGAISNIGASAQTLDRSTQAAVGTIENIGTATQTTDDATQQAVGGLTVTGEAIQSVDEAGQTASGEQVVSGVATQTADEASQEAQGGIPLPVTGDASQTIDAAVQSLSGEAVNIGTIEQTIDKSAQSAVGSVTSPAVTGEITQSADNVTQVAVGALTNEGIAAQTTDETEQAAAGSLENIGDVEQLADKTEQAAVGAIVVSGAIAQIADEATQRLSDRHLIPMHVENVNRPYIDSVKKTYIIEVGG